MPPIEANEEARGPGAVDEEPGADEAHDEEARALLEQDGDETDHVVVHRRAAPKSSNKAATRWLTTISFGLAVTLVTWASLLVLSNSSNRPTIPHAAGNNETVNHVSSSATTDKIPNATISIHISTPPPVLPPVSPPLNSEPPEGTIRPPLSSESASCSPDVKVPCKEQLPHVVLDDLRYRRVCTTVYSSTLCMMVRYPYELPLQDPSVDFPTLQDHRFEDLSKLIILDGDVLEDCRKNVTNETDHSMERRAYDCLEWTASSDNDTVPSDTVLALFTRRTATSESFFGTGTADQIYNVHKFFDRGPLITFGASPTPGITRCLASGLFGRCSASKKDTHCQFSTRTTQKEEPVMYNQYIRRCDCWYQPTTSNLTDKVAGLKDELWSKNKSSGDNADEEKDGDDGLKPLSVFIDFPIAHSQTQDLMDSNFNKVKQNQEDFASLVMSGASELAEQELASMGFKLHRLLVFDGLPQHNPTETGAFDKRILDFKSELDFVEANGYPGWRPELGSTCRGPLTPRSDLKQVNQIARDKFAELGLDMRFYGNIWEFANLFWWQHKQWNGKGGKLDCTHSTGEKAEDGFHNTPGMYCIHKYFVQAMVDDWILEQQGQ